MFIYVYSYFLFAEGVLRKAKQFYLNEAINQNNIERVKQLVDEGADLNCRFHFNTNPLCLAVTLKHTDIVKVLVEGGADVLNPDTTKARKYPLHHAAALGLTDIICILLTKDSEMQMDATDVLYMRPLHWAAWNGHLPTVKHMIMQGTEVNVCDDVGRTPLHRAAERDHVAVAKLLVQSGAVINAQDVNGWSPLFQSVICNQADIVKTLVNLGIDVNLLTHNGDNALHFAVARLRNDILPTLLSTAVEVYRRHLRATNPALPAMIGGERCSDIEIIKTLVNAGIDVNCVNGRGETPLYLAASEGCTSVVRFLILAGANLTLEGWISQGRFPIRLLNHPDFCEWLLQQAASVVKPLSDLCRFALRRHLSSSKNISLATTFLPLPKRLKAFLQLKDFEL